MDVLSYLSELIQTRKAVGITGLGTVFKKKIPGRYDAETHSFVPPSYTLDFTTEVKEDVILAAYIGKKRNVSSDTATYFISEFSADTLRRLNNDHEADFAGLGKLVKVEEQIRFEPAESINYGFDFYGLPVVKDEQELPPDEILADIQDVEETPADPVEPLPPAETEEPTIESVIADNTSMEENPGDGETPAAPEATAPTETEVPQENQETPATEPVNPFAQYKKNEQQLREEIESLNFYRSKSPYLKSTGPADEDVILKLNNIIAKDDTIAEVPPIDPYPVYPSQAEENKTMPLYVKILLSVVILVLMMGIVYFLKPELFSSLTGKSSAPAKPLLLSPPKAAQNSSQVDSPGAADSIQKSGAALPAVTEDTIIKTMPSAPADTATVYEIIGASMHDQKEADNFIALMKRSGINAKVVTNMSGKRLKMSIATLKDEKSAKEELDRLSKKLKIPGIYIYRNKQK
ncbi:hypothetical protein [Pedobacter hartonius]|uniref:CCDC81-like prokaryotic HU domain-containing protein n=1 Tax=Pedobacter hartonius TaxID=425514 RepID=A0A1H3XQV4_9SPHI|nr:hypothetical protein [Pedobacter hartonius]SEA01736.1 hypothetical protein SAMN05443550_101697 [Pedobacter hartonius]